jgi:hypothetical protein
MKSITKADILHSIKLKCKDANPMQTELLISSIKRFKKDDLAYVLKRIQVLPNGEIRLTKTKPSKVIESLFYTQTWFCTNCEDETTYQVPKGVLWTDYSKNLVCLNCGCKYDICSEDNDQFA